MASSSRPRAAVIAAGLLLAAPAGAQTPDAPQQPQPQPQAPPQGGGPAQPPAAPVVKVRPMSQQPMSQQSAGTGAPQRGPRRGAPWNKGKRGQASGMMNGAPLAGAPSFIRLDDGATRVELEVSSRVDIAENKARGRVVYRLRGAQVGERTNQLPLLTGFFSTPVDRMQLVQQGPDVDLVIDLREASEPTQRVVETPRGIVLQVDFPRSVSFERHHEQAPDTTSRERARRRNSTQTLGGTGSNGLPSDEDGN